ncbi:hypothetical protein Dsin_020106 [Dipteronia sinensis]|uniref:Uncharacterized protein n=1 Tax=Dipteronia sinensis TaxID=43782 RepID=A0AAE0A8T7_9ROSI|nr:hypothetical protein Dsin_020106 [Dipteronia sinensis]
MVVALTEGETAVGGMSHVAEAIVGGTKLSCGLRWNCERGIGDRRRGGQLRDDDEIRVTLTRRRRRRIGWISWCAGVALWHANRSAYCLNKVVCTYETAASDVWVKLFAHVTDQIKATEKQMTASFTRQFNILREEVRTLRNEPDTQLPKWTSVYDDHHDWGNLLDGTFPNHDSTKATVDTYPAPKSKHMESTTHV